jgi:hypothetical protein
MGKVPSLGKKEKTLDDLAPVHDSQKKHAAQLNEDASTLKSDQVNGDEPDEDEDDPVARVEVLGAGHFVNNHPLPIGTVIEMKLSDVEIHRQQGYQLGPVDDDYDGPVYDTSTEWQHPNNEKQAAE